MIIRYLVPWGFQAREAGFVALRKRVPIPEISGGSRK